MLDNQVTAIKQQIDTLTDICYAFDTIGYFAGRQEAIAELHQSVLVLERALIQIKSVYLHQFHAPALVRQKTSTTCGQCVIATLYRISRASATEIIGHDGITSDAEIRDACATEHDFAPGPPPPGCVAVQKHREPGGEREHWTLFWRDQTLDPANIKGLWPVSKHLIIDWTG